MKLWVRSLTSGNEQKMMEGCAGLGTLLHLPLNTERLRKLTENYVVSNEKIKLALGIDRMPVRAADGIMKQYGVSNLFINCKSCIISLY